MIIYSSPEMIEAWNNALKKEVKRLTRKKPDPGYGLFEAIKNSQSTYTHNIDNQFIINTIKEIFKEDRNPRHVIVSYDFIIAYREQSGDDAFYSFVTQCHVMGGEDTVKYIADFVSDYESNNVKKQCKK